MWQFENEYLDWLPIFEDLIISDIDVIIMTSIYSLPDDIDRRNLLMELAINSKTTLLFANESFYLRNEEEKEKINTYLNFGHKHKGWMPWKT